MCRLFQDVPMIDSIEAEFRRYKALAEAALAQVSEDGLVRDGPGGGNSLAVICWHVAGNLRSRFTDFLTTDGEKPWRARDEEFAERKVPREALLARWEEGWSVLFGALSGLGAADLERTVTIRGQALRVHDALHRSLAHISYHVGQIIYVAHSFKGAGWTYLSIPPGRSAEYNQRPGKERPDAHAAALPRRDRQ